MGWEGRPVLWSAEAKFRKGSDHLEALKNEVDAWGKGDVAVLALEANADATEHSLIHRWTEEPPIVRWGVLIGDCVHNFRSSLDHAVYELAVAKTGADPPPYADALAFPICDTDQLFTNAIGRHRLGNLASDSDLRAALERLQPYCCPRFPDMPVLAILRDLDDQDKHRIVSIMAAGLRTGELEMKLPPMDPWPHIRSRIWTRGPMQESTKVVTLIFDRPAPGVEISNPVLSLYPVIEVEKLDGTTDVVGLSAILELIRDEVRYCLDAIRRLL